MRARERLPTYPAISPPAILRSNSGLILVWVALPSDFRPCFRSIYLAPMMGGHVAQCPCCGGEGASFGRFRVLAAQLGAGAAQAAQPPAAAPGEHHRCLPSKPPTMARAAASWDRWERLKARIDAGELILREGTDNQAAAFRASLLSPTRSNARCVTNPDRQRVGLLPPDASQVQHAVDQGQGSPAPRLQHQRRPLAPAPDQLQSALPDN